MDPPAADGAQDRTHLLRVFEVLAEATVHSPANAQIKLLLFRAHCIAGTRYIWMCDGGLTLGRVAAAVAAAMDQSRHQANPLRHDRVRYSPLLLLIFNYTEHAK